MTENPNLDAARLWAGGGATAVVAGLIAIVGILIARGLVHVAVLAPKGEGVWGNANTLTYTLVSAAVAVGATGLLHLLILSVPRPLTFFNWIMVLLALIAVVLPLSLPVDVASRITTAIINLVIGLTATGMLNGVAASATRVRTPPAETMRWEQGPQY